MAYAVKFQNISQDTVFNVKLKLIHMSDSIEIVSLEVNLGNIATGAVVQSQDQFEVILISNVEFEYTRQIEYDMQAMDASLMKELYISYHNA